MPLLAGAAAGSSLTPWGVPPVLWLALVPLWSLGPRQAAVWGGTAVAVSHGWLLWLHPLTWLGVPAPLSLPLVLLILVICSGLGAVLVALWCALVQRLDGRRWPTALLAAALWALAESWLATGPLFWVGLAVAPLPHDRPLAGLAALGGGVKVGGWSGEGRMQGVSGRVGRMVSREHQGTVEKERLITRGPQLHQDSARGPHCSRSLLHQLQCR